MRISDWSSDVCSSDLPLFIAVAAQGDNQLRVARTEIERTAAELRRLLILSAFCAAAALGSAFVGFRIMSATVVNPLERMAGALSSRAPLKSVPGTERQDEIGQVARALEASMQRAADAVRLEREAAEIGRAHV